MSLVSVLVRRRFECALYAEIGARVVRFDGAILQRFYVSLHTGVDV